MFFPGAPIGVAGKVLIKDRELFTLDEFEIATKAREQAAQV
jgi:hypothetical protein